MVVLAQSAQLNPKLQGVKWRFLSEAALSYSVKPSGWTEGPMKRIGHLEKALASTHDLEAQYRSFLQEVARSDPSGTIFDGVGPGWVGIRGSYGVDSTGLMEPDVIPSDPMPSVSGAASKASGAPAAAAAESAEDAEVARVHALGGGHEAGEERPESPSPVIIWRHAAPVKIATNVPADLLEEHEMASTRPGRRAAGQALSGSSNALHKARIVQPPVQPIDPRRAQAAAALNRRMSYGVWYLPKHQWESRAFDAGRGGLGASSLGGAGTSSKSSSGPNGGSSGGPSSIGTGASSGSVSAGGAHHGASADGADPDDLAEQIPKLYSSRTYKDYLRSQHITRLPHYLQRVQSPKESAKGLSSRRGNIPLIEGEGATADGTASP